MTIRIINARKATRRQLPPHAFARGVRGRYATAFNESGLQLNAPAVKIHVWAPLAELNFAGTTQQLARDVRIEADVNSNIWERKEFEDFLSKDEKDLCRQTSHWLHLTRPAHDVVSSKANINAFLLALWTVRPTATYASLRFEESDAEGSAHARSVPMDTWASC